jgi:predicted Zn-dependent peptidase
MYEDHPHWRIFFNLLESLYRVHPVRNDIAGTIESIAEITPELLYRCYNTFYHPSNMAVFIVGDLEPQAVAEQVAEDINGRCYGQIGQIVRNYPDEPDHIMKEKVVQELVVSEPIFYLGFKDIVAKRLSGNELMRRDILMELVLDIIFGTSEQLYNDLYRENLIDEGFGFEYTAESNYAYTMIGGETRNPDLLYEQVMKAIVDTRRNGITEEQFERHRRKILGGYIRRFNSLEFIANNFLAYRFRESDMFELPRILQEVSREEALALAVENLDLSRHAVSIIMPSSNG